MAGGATATFGAASGASLPLLVEDAVFLCFLAITRWNLDIGADLRTSRYLHELVLSPTGGRDASLTGRLSENPPGLLLPAPLLRLSSARLPAGSSALPSAP